MLGGDSSRQSANEDKSFVNSPPGSVPAVCGMASAVSGIADSSSREESSVSWSDLKRGRMGLAGAEESGEEGGRASSSMNWVSTIAYVVERGKGYLCGEDPECAGDRQTPENTRSTHQKRPASCHEEQGHSGTPTSTRNSCTRLEVITTPNFSTICRLIWQLLASKYWSSGYVK